MPNTGWTGWQWRLSWNIPTGDVAISGELVDVVRAAGITVERRTRDWGSPTDRLLNHLLNPYYYVAYPMTRYNVEKLFHLLNPGSRETVERYANAYARGRAEAFVEATSCYLSNAAYQKSVEWLLFGPTTGYGSTVGEFKPNLRYVLPPGRYALDLGGTEYFVDTDCLAFALAREIDLALERHDLSSRLITKFDSDDHPCTVRLVQRERTYPSRFL